MLEKQVVKCLSCGTLYRCKKYDKRMFCKVCKEETNFIVKKERKTLIDRKIKPFNIRCKSCSAIGLIDNGKIPKSCPRCGISWKKKQEEDETITDILLDILTHKKSGSREGYFRCTHLGWAVDPDDLPNPDLDDDFLEEEVRHSPHFFNRGAGPFFHKNKPRVSRNLKRI